jgi:hypothetical protein
MQSLKLLAFPLILVEFEGVVSVDCSNFLDPDLCTQGFALVLVFHTEAEVTVDVEAYPEDMDYPLWFLKPIHTLLHLQLFSHHHKMTL